MTDTAWYGAGASSPATDPLGRQAWDRLFDTLPIGVYMCDAAGRVVRYNAQAAKLWGRSPDLATADHHFCGAHRGYELSGEPVAPADIPMAKALRLGRPVRGRELIVERPDGSRIFVQVDVEPLFDDEGTLVGGVNCLQDITLRKESELRRARDQEMLRTIIETTPECIKIVAADGTLVQMNAAGRRILEAEQGVEGAKVLDLVAPEDRAIWQERHERVCHGERLNWEFDMISLKGRRRSMETHGAPLRMPDGRLAQLAVTRDITDQKETRRKTYDGEHGYRELLQALPAAIYTTDLDGRITFFNDAAVEFAGREPELGEQWCVTWRLYRPDGSPLPKDECPMAVALREKRAVREAEAIAERPDGSRRWFTPYPTPLTDSSGEVTGAINMLVDITPRKEAERHQKLLIDELNHRVKNTLATVQSLLVQTARSAASIEEYRDTVEARLLAMSNVHNQLSRRNWSDADFRELALACLAPYLDSGNVLLVGEPVIVPPRTALMLAMGINELAINAAKFGALSCPDGRVDLIWSLSGGTAEPLLQFDWIESGGPVVRAPSRRGFGTRLVEQGMKTELRAKSSIEFPPTGLVCRLEVPLEHAA